ncbi:UbiA prenyltransferase family-domain-containing protein [Rhizoctonia solani]|nr:UbiA prenyltransferase family-domain-containing protein [Rhizoctonia solani]
MAKHKCLNRIILSLSPGIRPCHRNIALTLGPSRPQSTRATHPPTPSTTQSFKQFFLSNPKVASSAASLDMADMSLRKGKSRAFDIDVDSDMYPEPALEQSTTRPNASTSSTAIPLVPYPPPHIPLSAYSPIPALTLKSRLKIYMALSKSRLTTLVVLTAMSGVALCPLPATVSALLATAAGTTLCSAAANTFNQVAEVPLDAQMVRTRTRPLVRRAISPAHATAFGMIAGASGITILATLVNPLTAALGAFNIVLYSGVYTYMKRRSIFNTWVGGVVGAIPPLMGWTACGGHLLPSPEHPLVFVWPSSIGDLASTLPLDNPLAAATLFAFLFAWQFPHFNAVSHLTRAGYAQAGYKMLSVLDPRHNGLVGFRYALAFIPICSLMAPLSGLTTWWFALTSLPLNIWLSYGAWQFWREGSEKAARTVWRQCLLYLPVMLGLMMASKPSLNWSASIKKALGYDQDEQPAVVVSQ